MPAFTFQGTVRWSETDASGRFHYANALLWAEEAEHALCRQIDAAAPISQIPRRAVSADYLRPFEAGDAYMVRLWVDRLGNSSVRYGWQIFHGAILAVEGRHSVVHVDESGRAASLPERLRAGLTDFLREQADD